jgi:hypothetical protein
VVCVRDKFKKKTKFVMRGQERSLVEVDKRDETVRRTQHFSTTLPPSFLVKDDVEISVEGGSLPHVGLLQLSNVTANCCFNPEGLLSRDGPFIQ